MIQNLPADSSNKLDIRISPNDKEFQINLTNRIREINPQNLYHSLKKTSTVSL